MNWRFTVVKLTLALALSALPLCGEIIDSIVAVLNNTFIITQSDIRKERAIRTALGANPGDDSRVLEFLIEKRIFEEQIALFRAIEVDERAVEQILRGVAVPQGVSAAELRETVRSDVRRNEFTVQRFGPFIQVSDDELRKYFEEITAPALRRDGQAVPPIEQGMLEIRRFVIADKMSKEVDGWLEDIRRRTTIEKILK